MKKVIGFSIGIIFFLGLFWLLSQPPKTEIEGNQSNQNVTSIEENKYQNYLVYDNPDLVFYFGDTCSHCKNVEDWLDKNNSDQKIKINYKEVYRNEENQASLYDIAQQYCPEVIENGQIGVPFGFDPATQKCTQGDSPVIEFLTSKLTE